MKTDNHVNLVQTILTAFIVMLFGLLPLRSTAQYTLPEERELTNTSGLWLGTYTKYRIRPKLFYYGEYHYRRRNNIARDMAQIYLRFGMTYLANPKFELTAGIVTPIYWNPNYDPNLEGSLKTVPQFRFWEQAVFVVPMDRFKIYHQLRFEQRWRKDFLENAEFDLTYRFRYKITLYAPLNNTKLVNQTLFLSFYEEIFMQAGKSILFNHFEDNRIYLGLGYIINENMQVQAGYMWTYRHNQGPFSYESRHIPRVSFYHNLDFTKKSKNSQSKPIFLDDTF